MKVLLTGGAGYIGSHTYVVLSEHGHQPVILDNFSNSNRNVLERLEALTNRPLLCEEGSVHDKRFLTEVLKRHQFDGVIHFAGSKSVAESCQNPLLYYQQNTLGLLTLLESMLEQGLTLLIFSGSSTVYGQPEILPATEDTPLQHASPYAHTKLIGEEIIQYTARANPTLKAGLLRYFNPVGSHESGQIGEDPLGIPTNLMPYICQVAVGSLPYIQIFGTDFETPDGTGIRDYIHVMDLAEGHVAALNHLQKSRSSFTINLGTGRGYSVLDILRECEAILGHKIPSKIMPRRPGDVACYYADPSRATALLGWKAKRDLRTMCRDALNWQKRNPKGYRDVTR